MNKLLFLLLLTSYLYSYETTNIDMHGGKEEKLIKEKINFARKGIDYLLKSKSNKNTDNKTNPMHIKIDDIQNINF